jgi:hypothetical protein
VHGNHKCPILKGDYLSEGWEADEMREVGHRSLEMHQNDLFFRSIIRSKYSKSLRFDSFL